MKLPKTKTLDPGRLAILNEETGEEITLGNLPTLRVRIGEPTFDRDAEPAVIQCGVRFTWWSYVKLRLFLWWKGFAVKYYTWKWYK